jgi:hypothetical protein
MSERMVAEIWIGGKIAASLVPDLCEAIADEGVSTEWGGGGFEPATAHDLLKAVKPNRDKVPLLWLCNGEATWGEFSSLEAFLQDRQIAFTRVSEGKYEYDPEMLVYRPSTGRIEIATDSSGEPMVPISPFVAVEAELSKVVDAVPVASLRTILRAIRSARNTLRCALPPTFSPLEAFEIVPCTNLEPVCHG